MEWWVVLILLFGGLSIMMAAGVPVAFSFGMLNIIFAFFIIGGLNSLRLIAMSSFSSVATFEFSALPMFVLMGEILLHSGLASNAIRGISKWIGRVPGRLGIISVLSGTVFAAASGSSMASVATIGSGLVPEMVAQRYHKGLATGVIAVSGALAVLIPPSGLMVIFGGISKLSIGALLIAGILPGLLIGGLLLIYITGISYFIPAWAPPYDISQVTWRERLIALRDIFPIVFLILFVVGTIFFGIVTPTESAALGSLGGILIALVYRRLNLKVLYRAAFATVQITGFSLFIITGATTFSQVLAFSGALSHLSHAVINLPLPPLLIICGMQGVILIMGGFMDSISIMLITIPIFMPIVKALGFDLLWFAILTMVNVELGLITPPFGMNLFVLKGVCPKEITLEMIYRGIWPFVAINLLALGIIILVPQFATLLPQYMTY